MPSPSKAHFLPNTVCWVINNPLLYEGRSECSRGPKAGDFLPPQPGAGKGKKGISGRWCVFLTAHPIFFCLPNTYVLGCQQPAAVERSSEVGFRRKVVGKFTPSVAYRSGKLRFRPVVSIFDSTPFSGRAPILCFFTGHFAPGFRLHIFFVCCFVYLPSILFGFLGSF